MKVPIKDNILISVVSYNSIQALSSELVILASPWLERQTWLSPVVGVKINITIFFFSLTGQERFGNMTRVGLFVLHHIHAAQVTYMLWFNGLFPASHSHGTKPPCWRAKVALRQDKQKKLPFKFMYVFCLSCSSAAFALQRGGFDG